MNLLKPLCFGFAAIATHESYIQKQIYTLNNRKNSLQNYIREEEPYSMDISLLYPCDKSVLMECKEDVTKIDKKIKKLEMRTVKYQWDQLFKS